MATITFLGGTDTVTGSKFLLASGGASLLVDCGLFQGPDEMRRLNWEDPAFQESLPREVLLTHAHIDHSGYLPRLVGHYGFAGPVRATSATVDLLGVLLPDSGRLQEETAEYANRKGYSRHHPALPLYTEEDARRALDLLAAAPYHEWFDVAGGRARLSVAGHILGSAHATVEIEGRRVVFSGDVGRWGIPVLKDPEPPTGADLLLLESTYGGRRHEAKADPDGMLAGAVEKVVRRRGIIVIPAFSVGRAQEILYRLRRLEESGRIPRLPGLPRQPDGHRRHRVVPPPPRGARPRDGCGGGRRPRPAAHLAPAHDPHRRGVQAPQRPRASGHHHLGFGHGHRGPGGPPPEAAPALPREPGGVRGLPGRGHPGAVAGGRCPDGAHPREGESRCGPRS